MFFFGLFVLRQEDDRVNLYFRKITGDQVEDSLEKRVIRAGNATPEVPVAVQVSPGSQVEEWEERRGEEVKQHSQRITRYAH